MHFHNLLRPKTLGLYASSIRTHVRISPWRSSRSKRECYLDNTEKPYTDRHNMAEFMYEHRTLKPWMQVIPKDKDSRYNDYVWHESYVSDPVKAKVTAATKLKRFEQSLIERQSAREKVPYQPTENVQNKIIHIFKSYINQGSEKASDEEIMAVDLNLDKQIKFELITRCIESFKHDLSNAFLNDIDTISDLVTYYNTPVRGVNPYTALIRQDESLPPNLTLAAEPIRFDIENDTFFKGFNALPGLVSKVPGLRARNKFPVLNQSEFQWPDI